MSTQLLFRAPAIESAKINNLWFQLSNTACNLSCSHCFLSCSTDKKMKKFLPLDKIKTALEQAKQLDVKEIYLTGGEPFLHPDLNNILRMSLKLANVVVLTNGTFINDKKARFLRQIEVESNNELIFRVSLDHYTQEKNDVLRGKGVFRKVMSCVENLVKYGFNPIISTVNYWNEDEDSIKAGFSKLFSEIDFNLEEINFKIIPTIKGGEYAKNYGTYAEQDYVTHEDLAKIKKPRFDCTNSRILSVDGVFSCPMLVGDPRGKVGSALNDMRRSVFLETGVCKTCVSCNRALLNNNWSV